MDVVQNLCGLLMRLTRIFYKLCEISRDVGYI